MTTLAPTLSFESVLAAYDAVSARLPMTPAWSYPLLDAELGGTVVVKHENVQPTGAFKVRGGVNLAATIRAGAEGPDWTDRYAGLITASTGNHAQSVTWAGWLLRVPVTVVVPESTPQNKRHALTAMGVRLVVHGPTMTEAVAHARELGGRERLRYVDPGGEPAIVHGHATVYLELFRQHPELEAVYVPVGSGTGAAGACLVRDALAPSCRIIGVQSSAAPAAYDAWRAGEPRTAPCRTRISGVATGESFALPQSVLRGDTGTGGEPGDARPGLAGFILVDDDAIDAAAALMATHAHTLAEGAGAAGLAGALADPNRPSRLAVICTGGNASADEIQALGRLAPTLSPSPGHA